MINNNILEALCEERMNSVLEILLTTDVEYQRATSKSNKKLDRLNEKKLTKKQRRAIDEFATSCNYSSSAYGAAAYKQGFRDCFHLLSEMRQ